MAVREIRGWTPATPLPRAPAYMRGVINLRGAVLPIVDLAAAPGLRRHRADARHVIIVVQIGEQHRRPAGRRGVRHPDGRPTTSIQPTPDVACDSWRALRASGIIAIDGRMIALIASDNVLPAGLELEAA